MPVSPVVSSFDKVVVLLCEDGWLRVPDLRVKGHADRPVFRKKWYTVVVGPVWTTYYKMVREHIIEIDSIKTTDYRSVECKVKEMNRG